jgi:hypothetical protein
MPEAWRDPAVELLAPSSYIEFVGTQFSYVAQGVFDRGMFCGRWHDTPPEMVLRWRPIPSDQIRRLEL